MSKTKVLVVDDSMTMRALLCGALERVKDVEVVGLANGAAEAREMVKTHRPHVMTLDIEMPGMSGIEYLAEIMENDPMPVIMFSTRTTDGAADSVEALRLGAVDCLPKPKVAAPAELDTIIGKLGKTIATAKNARMPVPGGEAGPSGGGAAIDWNGRLTVIGADASCTSSMFSLFGQLPADCPPMIVVQHLEPGVVKGMAEKMDAQVAPRVVVAEDDMAIEKGTIYFAPQGEAHLVVTAWPDGKLKLLPRDPVAGERPSISLLFASSAKAATVDVVGLLLLSDNEDGKGAANAIAGVRGHCLLPSSDGGFTMERGYASQPVKAEDLGKTLIGLLSK
jgi:two-component system chemotaxis response regulator CheB